MATEIMRQGEEPSANERRARLHESIAHNEACIRYFRRITGPEDTTESRLLSQIAALQARLDKFRSERESAPEKLDGCIRERAALLRRVRMLDIEPTIALALKLTQRLTALNEKLGDKAVPGPVATPTPQPEPEPIPAE